MLAHSFWTLRPEGDHWPYEVKWDGYRALLLKRVGPVQIRSRNNQGPYVNLSDPIVAAGAARLLAESAVVDSEMSQSTRAVVHRSRRRSIGVRSPTTRSRLSVRHDTSMVRT